jgi:hypothetical protein
VSEQARQHDVGGVVHITAQHASDDDNDSADEEVLLDNSATSAVVLRKGDTNRIKITNSSMTIMALVADNIILSSRAEAEPLFCVSACTSLERLDDREEGTPTTDYGCRLSRLSCSSKF